jgi:hypothetical protein
MRIGKTQLACLTVTVCLLGCALLWVATPGGAPDRVERELVALRAEVARIAARVDALGPREDGASAEPATLPTAEIERLGAEVRSLRQQLEAIAPVEAGAGSAGPGGGPAETVLSEARLAERLDELLRREPEGTEARRLATELSERIRAALPHGASLREVRCRPSLCRAEMTYPDLAAYQEFVESSLNGNEAGVWPGATFLQATNPELERGDVIAQAYLARDERIFTAPPAR